MRLRFWPVEASGEFASSLCWWLWSVWAAYGGETRGSIALGVGCANAGCIHGEGGTTKLSGAVCVVGSVKCGVADVNTLHQS
jgi:hypothetical protein